MIEAIKPHLHWYRPFAFTFTSTSRTKIDNTLEGFRLIPVFGRSPKHDFQNVSDLIQDSKGREKEYDDWQQSLPVVKELVRRLCPQTKQSTVVVDPHLGTGTTAVACAQLLGKQFIGCDIDANKVRIARHRIATEVTGKQVG